MADAYIAGAAMTRFGSRPNSLADLMAEAARGALTSAGLERPEALVVSAMNPEEFVGEGNFASRYLPQENCGGKAAARSCHARGAAG